MDQFRAEMRRHVADLDACYGPVLERRPCAAGTLTLRFDVAADGKFTVVSRETGSLTPDLAWCVELRSGTWSLPRPPRGPVVVHYPFVLKPAPPPGPAASCDATILAPVAYGGAQIPERFWPAGWHALCSSKDGASIQPVEVSLEPFFDEIAGDKPGQKTGREVKVRGCAKPRVVLRDVYGVWDGRVASAHVAMTGARGKRTARIKLGRDEFELRYDSKADGAAKLVLFHGGVSQTILGWSDDNAPSDWKIRWAGDLDGDGKLDFVIEEEDEGTVLRLFVSRAATKGRIVGLVAETGWGGC
jgi:hypothetical protein